MAQEVRSVQLERLGNEFLKANSVDFDRKLASDALHKMLEGVLKASDICLNDLELLAGQPEKAATVAQRLSSAAQNIVRLELFASADGHRGMQDNTSMEWLSKLSAEQLAQVYEWVGPQKGWAES